MFLTIAVCVLVTMATYPQQRLALNGGQATVTDEIAGPEATDPSETSLVELGELITITPERVVDRFHLGIPAEIRRVRTAGIYNEEGRKVRGFGSRIKGGTAQEFELDANDLVPGRYHFRIDTGSGLITRSFEVLEP
jgi:hypothetical protein